MTYWINMYFDYGQVWYSHRHETRELAVIGAQWRKPICRIKVTPKVPA